METCLNYCKFTDHRLENIRKKLVDRKEGRINEKVMNVFAFKALEGETSCFVPFTHLSTDERICLVEYGFEVTNVLIGTVLDWEKRRPVSRETTLTWEEERKERRENILYFPGTSMISPVYL